MGVEPLIDNDLGQADENARRLQNAVNMIFAEGGGYVYLPQGRYFIGRSEVVRPLSNMPREENADIVVPHNVTLWFAPGAILVPMSFPDQRRMVSGIAPSEQLKVRIEIHGDIIADLRQIFDAQIDVRNAEARITISRDAGRILLVGNRIREVYPEWWGAQSGAIGASDVDPGGQDRAHDRTTRAIQAAIDAAYRFRSTPDRDASGELVSPPRLKRRSSIPIVMMGEYYINKTIRFGVEEEWTPESASSDPYGQPPEGGFELVGERGVGNQGSGKAALIAVSTTTRNFGGTALLSIRGPVGFSIREVNINANFVARNCVSVEPIDGSAGWCEFANCTFLNTLETLVHLDAESRRRWERPPLEGTGRVPSPHDFWNISFTQCRFVTGQVESIRNHINSRAIPDVEGNLSTIRVQIGDNEGLELRGCLVSGPGSPLVRLVSGRMSINECVFNAHRPEYRVLTAAQTNERFEFRHGVDVSIEPPEAHPNIPTDRLLRRVVPAALTAREVETQSPQFLATPISPLPGASTITDMTRRSAVILLNVGHAFSTQSMEWSRAPMEFDPPAVYWEAPGAIGCPLIMIGCQFAGSLMRRGYESATEANMHQGNRGSVYYGPNIRGDIYSVATFLRAGQPSSEAVVPRVAGTATPVIRELRPGRVR